MGFLKRLGWYLFGLSIGLVFLVFFFKKKSEETGVDFCYLANCRVLKDMRSKKLVFSEKVTAELTKLKLDSAAVKSFLLDGEVDFSQSDTKSTPCKFYVIEKETGAQKIKLGFSSCKDTVILIKVR